VPGSSTRFLDAALDRFSYRGQPRSWDDVERRDDAGGTRILFVEDRGPIRSCGNFSRTWARPRPSSRTCTGRFLLSCRQHLREAVTYQRRLEFGGDGNRHAQHGRSTSTGHSDSVGGGRRGRGCGTRGHRVGGVRQDTAAGAISRARSIPGLVCCAAPKRRWPALADASAQRKRILAACRIPERAHPIGAARLLYLGCRNAPQYERPGRADGRRASGGP